LNEEPERKEQTEDDEKDCEADRKPIDRTELQIEKQRREHRRPDCAQEKSLRQLPVVSFEGRDLEVANEDALAFDRFSIAGWSNHGWELYEERSARSKLIGHLWLTGYLHATSMHLSG
jgi:hypothetical protein